MDEQNQVKIDSKTFIQHRRFLHDEIVDSYTQLGEENLKELHDFVDSLEFENPVKDRYIKKVREKINSYLVKVKPVLENNSKVSTETKFCVRCETVKPLSAFGKHAWCRQCYTKYMWDRREHKPKPPKIEGQRFCPKCNQSKDVSLFRKEQAYCKECIRKYQNERYAMKNKNLDKINVVEKEKPETDTEMMVKLKKVIEEKRIEIQKLEGVLQELKTLDDKKKTLIEGIKNLT